MFKVESVDLSCEDGPCHWGSDATISGNYTFVDEVATQTPVVSASIWGINVYNDTVDVCDGGVVSNSNGDYCPSPGTYEYFVETELPGFSWLKSITSWFSIVVSTSFDFGNATVVCDVKVAANGSSSSNYSAMIVGSAAIGSAFVIFRMRNRRSVMTKLEYERENEPPVGHEPSTHFIEMTARSPVVAGAMV